MNKISHIGQRFAWGEDGELDRKLVTRCALARVCGVCGDPLGRPIAFVCTAEEKAAGVLHAPPMHEACATSVTDLLGGHLVLTAGFEFIRPSRGDEDPQVRFKPNSVL